MSKVEVSVWFELGWLWLSLAEASPSSLLRTRKWFGYSEGEFIANKSIEDDSGDFHDKTFD